MGDIKSTSILSDKEIILFIGKIDKPDSIIKKLSSEIELRYYIGESDIQVSGLELIEKTDDIEQIEVGGKTPFVLIASNSDKEIEEAAEELHKKGIQFDHVDFYLTERINVKWLWLMKKFEYTDWQNNHISISKEARIRKLYIDKRETSKDNIIRIGNIFINNVCYICPIGHNGYVEIGDFTTMQEVRITVNSGGIVKIGESCMISSKVNMMQSDQHPIFDTRTGKRINHVKSIIVDRHVWLGREVKLLPGAHIGMNSVVGAYAVTSSEFSENVIIAGCPAKIVRTNVIWSRDRLREGDYEDIMECTDTVTREYWQERRTDI